MTEPKKSRTLTTLKAVALGLFCAVAGQAATLETQAERTFLRSDALASYALPIGPWADGTMLTRQTEGAVEISAWRIDRPGITTFDLFSVLRAEALEQGFRVLFECDTAECGGFDFRFSTRVLPEPEMHVDLGDFRFLSAQRGQGEGAEHLALLVSRSRLAGFVQRIRVNPGTAPKPTRVPQGQPPGPMPPGPFAAQLQGGSVVLRDLDFQTGSGGLGPGPHPALVALADYLRSNPDHRIALVGHTDASGSFEGNRALSLRRAEEVRDRLIRDHRISSDRIEAHGVGYLVPRASNLTEEGRALNRRVEVALISTR